MKSAIPDIFTMSPQPLGFLLIDKPRELNSFGIVKYLRKTLNLKRIGYAGTLDPLATGLMIVAVGEATKLLTYLEKLDKVYEVEITLGITSATYDAEGPLTTVNWKGDFTQAFIEEVIQENFIGLREQKPPIYSAIQVQGKRAYALARKGIEVDLKTRAVNFFEIRLEYFSWPRLVLNVHCSSGTYIRSLAHDLGQILGCGGYVTALRRTKVGNVDLGSATILGAITTNNFHQFLVTPQKFFPDWIQLNLSREDYRQLAQGGFISNVNHFHSDHILALHEGQCVGILETVNEFQQLKFLKKFIIV